MNLEKVVKLTSSQYAILASGGSVGSYHGLNSAYLYMVENSVGGYIPLAGTTSLYGDVIPSTNNSVNLGSEYRAFGTVYAHGMSYPGDLSIYADTAVVGQGHGGKLTLVGGSSVNITAHTNIITMSAGTSVDILAQSGRAYIYASDVLRLAAGPVGGTPSQQYSATPQINMAMSGGYYPLIWLSAWLSGTGGIELDAGYAISLYAHNGHVFVDATSNVYLYASSNMYMSAGSSVIMSVGKGLDAKVGTSVTVSAVQMNLHCSGSAGAAIWVRLSGSTSMSASNYNINVIDRHRNVLPVHAGYLCNLRLQWTDYSYSGSHLVTSWPVANGYIQMFGLYASQNFNAVSTPALDYLWELLQYAFTDGVAAVMCMGELKTQGAVGWPHDDATAGIREDWVVRELAWTGDSSNRQLHFGCTHIGGGNNITYGEAYWDLSTFKPSGTIDYKGYTNTYYVGNKSFKRYITMTGQTKANTVPTVDTYY